MSDAGRLIVIQRSGPSRAIRQLDVSVMRALSWLFPDGRPDPAALASLPESERTRAVSELCQIVRLALVGWDVPEALLGQAEELLACEDAFPEVRGKFHGGGRRGQRSEVRGQRSEVSV